MCGIGAVIPKRNNLKTSAMNKKARKINNSLTSRGNSSSGVVVINSNPFNYYLNRARSNCSFEDSEPLQEFYKSLTKSHPILAHTRFITDGGSDIKNAQPLIAYSSDGESINIFNEIETSGNYVNDTFHQGNSLCLVHNGEITIPKIDDILSSRGHTHNPEDSESDSNLLTAYLLSSLIENDSSIVEAMKEIENDVSGSYSLIGAANTENFNGFFAYTDGRRCLAIAETPDFFAVASETEHLIGVGINKKYVHMMEPGELYTFEYNYGRVKYNKHHITDNIKPGCFFEDPVYLRMHTSACNPLPPQIFDPKFISVLNGTIPIENYIPSEEAVAKSKQTHACMCARELIGQWFFRLRGDEIPKEYKTIVGVPKSGLSFKDGIVMESGEPGNHLVIGRQLIDVNPVYKNESCPRSFLSPQDEREENPIEKLIYRKMPDYVILSEDSIVTGTTIKDVIKKCYENGAKHIILTVGSPQIIYPCRDGINMKDGRQFAQQMYPDKTPPEIRDLVVNNLASFEEDAAKYLGIDKVMYMPLKPLELLLGKRYSFGCVGGTPCSYQIPA